MTPAFSALQRDCLQALGYTLYRPATLVASSAPCWDADAPLARAIARAARHVDVAALALDQAALRRDGNAKRALWRQLRSLRRG